jgi:alpha-tubulin suppressor-like RCC1 family protein
MKSKMQHSLLRVLGFTVVAACGADQSTGPATVNSPSGNVTKVVAGSLHTCAIKASGQLYCWGNIYGEQSVTNSTRPLAITGGLSFTGVSGIWDHNCGVTQGGGAYCWGTNTIGRLGDGTLTNHSAPTAVVGGLTFAEVSAGYYHSCGVTTSGAAYCWGGGYDGVLGDGTTTDRLAPTKVFGDLTFSMVSAGINHTCGVTTSGAAYCWGNNYYGRLGDGTTTTRLVPTHVAGGLTFATVSVGSDTCGLTRDGKAYCWGGAYSASGPTPFGGDLVFVAISMNQVHACAVTTSGGGVLLGQQSLRRVGRRHDHGSTRSYACSRWALIRHGERK